MAAVGGKVDIAETERGGALGVFPSWLEVFRWPEHEEEGEHNDIYERD